MAQGGIKKGFFFYFGLFVLLLIAIFCICLVVMMFNPGSTVLWMQYFTDNRTFQVLETTDESKQPIVWSTVESIEINCSAYANVVVERNSDNGLQQYAAKGVSRDGLYIVNNAKGFTAAASAQKFSYDVRFDSGVLKIEIKEPTGFIYFSKDIRVILHATTMKTAIDDATWNFEKVDLTVKTDGGNVTIGGAKAHQAEEIKLSKLNVETKGGSISLTEMFDPTSLKDNGGNGISLKTENGTISSERQMEYAGKSLKGLQLNCNGLFSVSRKGRIAFQVIKAEGKKILLTCDSGNWDIDYLCANEIDCVNCVDGNYIFGEIVGKLNVNSQDSIKSPNIVIEKIDGDFFLETNVEKNGRPNIQIDEITGKFSVLADKGNVKVKKACQSVIIGSHDDLRVDVTMAENANKFVSIVTENGEVRLAFLGSVPTEQQNDEGRMVPGVSITTTKKVTIDVTTAAKFEANMFVYDGKQGDERTKIADDKISVNIGNELLEGETKNPLNVNKSASGTSGKIEIITNGKVDFNLKQKAELSA